MTAVTSYEVDRWNVNGKQILLFRQRNETSAKLKYRIEDGQSSPVEIPSHLYSNINWIDVIVSLFHDVIQDNLQHSIEPSSFTPVLQSTAQIKQLEQYVGVDHLKVALFGRGDSSTKTVDKVRWGIFNEQDNSTKIIEVQKIEGDLQECLINVLCNRYYVSFYANHRIEVSLDSDGQVQSLALTILSRPNSIFDTSVSLDENHWAVTLISTKQEFSNRRISAGHAMIACEGVNEGRQFMKYVHITKKPEEEDTTKFPSGARVEVLERVKREDIRNGPTWRRARAAVENILVLAQKAQQERQMVPFTLGNGIFKITSFISRSFILVSLPIFYYCCYRYYQFFTHNHESAFRHFFFSDPGVTIGLLQTTASYVLKRAIGVSQTAARSIMESSITPLVMEGSMKTLQMTASMMLPMLWLTGAMTSNKLASRYDCLSWAVEQLSKAGIHFQLPLPIITPNGAVKYLNLHVKVIVLKDS